MVVLHWLKDLVRTRQGRFIAAFLTLQLALPLHYYVARADRHDERFAWRMFSPMRMVVCSDPGDADLPRGRLRRPPRFTVDDDPVNLFGEFHEAWIEIARRGRYVVLEKMAARLCAEHAGKAVKLKMTCEYLDGSEEQVAPTWNLCTVKKLWPST
jgi:hypothetical protein